MHEIQTRLETGQLTVLQRDRLHAVKLAAKGDSTYSEIAEVLGRARSAVERWIERYRRCRGELDEYLKIDRYRKSPLQDQDIVAKLKEAYFNEGVNTGAKASKWLLQNYGIKRAASTMHGWLPVEANRHDARKFSRRIDQESGRKSLG